MRRDGFAVRYVPHLMIQVYFGRCIHEISKLERDHTAYLEIDTYIDISGFLEEAMFSFSSFPHSNLKLYIQRHMNSKMRIQGGYTVFLIPTVNQDEYSFEIRTSVFEKPNDFFVNIRGIAHLDGQADSKLSGFGVDCVVSHTTAGPS